MSHINIPLFFFPFLPSSPLPTHTHTHTHSNYCSLADVNSPSKAICIQQNERKNEWEKSHFPWVFFWGCIFWLCVCVSVCVMRVSRVFLCVCVSCTWVVSVWQEHTHRHYLKQVSFVRTNGQGAISLYRTKPTHTHTHHFLLCTQWDQRRWGETSFKLDIILECVCVSECAGVKDGGLYVLRGYFGW